MKKSNSALYAALLYSFWLFFVSLNLEAAENTIVLGSAKGWGTVEQRTQVDEINAVRPNSVLTLSSAMPNEAGRANGAGQTSSGSTEDFFALYAAFRNFPVQESVLDLALSFDEGVPERFADNRKNYRVVVSRAVQAVNERWARYGRGAALFTGENKAAGAPVTVWPGPSALFAPGRSIRDFSIEFWLFPNAMENGEQVVAWTAAENQRIFCETVRNRMRWTFQNFFAPPDRLRLSGRAEGRVGTSDRLTLSVESRVAIIPRSWSHHLIRYNADTGLLEYLVNGRIENMCYTTANGREGGDVYTPLINWDGVFILGNRFSGMMDEFRIYNKVINTPGHSVLEKASYTALELPELSKFPRGGGRFETRTIDLGEMGSTVKRIEASGGRLGFASAGSKAMTVKNTYAGKGNFRFPDNSSVQFFIRAGEEPYRFGNIPWIPVVPGQSVPGTVRGRYVQIAADFYPSGDCSASPYLEELRIVYNRNDPPYPPSLVTVRPLDGAVELSWRPSPDEHARGYLVYYGTSRGVYYGEDASFGASPINVGNRTSIRLEGLKNGTLYFFVIAAYDGTGPRPEDLHPGKFSKEVSARPLRTGQ
ncbi:MAG: fibronectin type III domain-containing protein [Treponema sp.]|nr:fibronectin type III domain-containing protein [Treponema sp.]